MITRIFQFISLILLLPISGSSQSLTRPEKPVKIFPPLQVALNSQPLQQHKIWIFFTDKEIFDQATYKASASNSLQSFSEKARLRRQGRGAEPSGDFHDIPVSERYIDAVKQIGAEIIWPSRWLNAVAVNSDYAAIQQIAALPFVNEIKPVARGVRKPLPESDFRLEKPHDDPDYGGSFTQLNMVNIPLMHHLGFTGEGILIAFFDTGFELNHPSLSGLNLIDKYDFINNDTSVGDPENSQPYHGTLTLSVCGGYAPGSLIGAAYGADYLLYKTEKTYAEDTTEEVYWIRAADRADSVGADIISSSLGYIDWYSNLDGSAIYSMLDGNTAPITIAADIAASRGISVFNAAGNERDDPFFYITPPADADSIISVGAVNYLDSIAGYSSSGPTYDGRIKPEIVAMGVNVRAANFTGGYTLAGGTSLSTPIAAGAGAILLQIHPDWNPIQLRDALIRSSDKYESPDNLYGYGLFDTFKASGLVRIAPISPIRLALGDTLSLTITATGAEIPALSATGLPDSARFVDSQDGTATLEYIAREEDLGSRTVRFIAVAGAYADTAEVLFTVLTHYQITVGPNPFSDSLTIFLEGPAGNSSKISIHTVSGEKVWEKISDNNSTPSAKVVWRGENDRGKKVAPGVYIVIIATENTVEKIKVLKKI